MIVALLALWLPTLAWLIFWIRRDLLRDRADRTRQQELRHVAAKRATERREDERAHRERLRRQQRQIEALDALYELPSAGHRGGGRTR